MSSNIKIWGFIIPAVAGIIVAGITFGPSWFLTKKVEPETSITPVKPIQIQGPIIKGDSKGSVVATTIEGPVVVHNSTHTTVSAPPQPLPDPLGPAKAYASELDAAFNKKIISIKYVDVRNMTCIQFSERVRRFNEQTKLGAKVLRYNTHPEAEDPMLRLNKENQERENMFIGILKDGVTSRCII